MTVEEIKKNVSKFLETLDKQKLINFNPKLWNVVASSNFEQRTTLVTTIYEKILVMYYETKDSKITDEEIAIFSYTFFVNILVSYLEFIKTGLLPLIDDKIISFSEETTYGTILRRICDKLGYNKNQRKTIFDSFFVDFRNAFSHQRYNITKDGVFVEKDGKKIHLDLDKLNEFTNEIKGILEVFIEFGIKKITELDKKIKEQENNTEKLKKITEKLKGTSRKA